MGGQGLGVWEPVETAAWAAPALFHLSSKVVSVQFSADETKHFTKLSPVPQWASGCTCGHTEAANAQWGMLVSSGVGAAFASHAKPQTGATRY